MRIVFDFLIDRFGDGADGRLRRIDFEMLRKARLNRDLRRARVNLHRLYCFDSLFEAVVDFHQGEALLDKFHILVSRTWLWLALVIQFLMLTNQRFVPFVKTFHDVEVEAVDGFGVVFGFILFDLALLLLFYNCFVFNFRFIFCYIY